MTSTMHNAHLALCLVLCTAANASGDFGPFRDKMKHAKLSSAAIESFERSYNALVSGDTGMLTEESIRPTEALPSLPAHAVEPGFSLENLSVVTHGASESKDFRIFYEHNGRRISPWHEIPLIAGKDTANPAYTNRMAEDRLKRPVRDCVNGDPRPECGQPEGCPQRKCAVPECARPVFRWGADGCRGCLECAVRPRVYHFVCEIPRGTTAKMEINKVHELNPIAQDLTKSGELRHYKYMPEKGSIVNYGALTQTWEDPEQIHPATGVGGDNDPIDVLQVNSKPCKAGQVMRVRVLGVLALVDGDETDWKVFVADVDDPESERLRSMTDVGEARVNQVREWFRLYKTAEGKGENRFGMDERVADGVFATDVVMETHAAWHKLRAGQSTCKDKKDKCWQRHSEAQGKISKLLQSTVMLKLNGGLGTSMGLDGPKSLLSINPEHQSFLEVIVEQVESLRSKHGDVKFMLMNSYATTQQTKSFLGERFPRFNWEELMQNEVPKVDKASLRPADWPEERSHEWCPPGHGDLYVSLSGSGKLKQLLAEGFEYLFVSNSDNLGASLDLGLLEHFAASDSTFMMEVCKRTASDKKGGHLAVNASNGNLLLRETAQCSDSDKAYFEDFERYQYFNTNNLWIKLSALQELMEKDQLRLPVMFNYKTVDPKNKQSPAVVQLEVAMGAAIADFPRASAIEVPRSRFAPVKKCSDLLVLRSDVYVESEVDGTLTLAPGVAARPVVKLDDEHYKLVSQFEASVAKGVPSLRKCAQLTVKGPVHFGPGVVIEGSVFLQNLGEKPRVLAPGVYKDMNFDLTNGDHSQAYNEL